ncbi:hypothetical protein SteCoe_8706 [Stentor coeruleus]|uniref:Importin N-terminal domain-containing protein n=1 Tax=Stentor coeruleus TaxID=5963 RepID=A0A1R2CJF3_9CILI|nr:hypothetical protein SteCoe_8706 [Stentor coeruleus]
MNQGLSRLAECLSLTLKEDKSLRKAAEEELQNMSKSPQEYFTGLIELILASHPEISMQLKNSAALNLKKFIKERTDADITKEQRLYYALNIFSALISNNMDTMSRGALGYALGPLFSGQNEVLQSFIPTLLTAMNSESYSLLGACKAIKSIFSGFVYNPTLFPFFKKILPMMVGICGKLIGAIQQAVQNNDPRLALEHTDILYEWTCATNSILEYLDISAKENLKEVKDMSELAEAFKAIIYLSTNGTNFALSRVPYDPSTEFLISISPNQISIKLNQAKTQVFKALNIIIQYLVENKKKIMEDESSEKVLTAIGIDIPESPFVNVVSELLPWIVLSLQSICAHPECDNLLELEYVSELFVEFLFILTKLCTDNRLIQYFNDSYKNIILNICFPLLKCTLSDIENFKENPEEFVSLSSDICEKQESETVKSTAASLLESICTKIDGSLKYVISTALEIIDFTVTQNTQGIYPNLSEYPDCIILKTSEELRIETSLLAICVVSYIVAKRKDLLNAVEKIFTTFSNTLYTNGTYIIKNRLCMLIHYFAEYVFLEEDDIFKNLLLIVLNCSDPKINESSSVNIQASETLCHMLQEEDILTRIYTYIPEIIFKLIELIDYQNNKAFFEALQEIVTTNATIVLPYLDTLVPSLINKVIKFAQKKSKLSIIVVKCWNIIRALVECKSLTDEQALQLELKFVPLFEYIQNPKEIEFDDDIILFEVSVMRKCKVVTEVAWNIFKHLHLVQEKYDNTFVQLFQILNCYIYYGKNVLSGNIAFLHTISEMCGKCLFAIYKSKLNEATNAEGALIFQQLLYTFKGQLNEVLPSILAFAILKLSTPIKNTFFKARLLGIILSGFAYDCANTLAILKTSQTPTGQTYFEYVFQMIMENTKIFKHPYDKKVAISGLCSLFSNPSLSEMFVPVFQAMIEILGQTSKDHYPIKQNITIREDNSLSALKDVFKDFNSEEMEANLALTTFLNPLEDFDEYDYFKNMVKSLQQNDLAIFIRSLNEIQLKRLQEILQSKKVQIGENPANTDIRRIVKPKKRYNQ